jgi:OPA family glycerol-3-phosphate transporter-like MFS transporter
MKRSDGPQALYRALHLIMTSLMYTLLFSLMISPIWAQESLTSGQLKGLQECAQSATPSEAAQVTECRSKSSPKIKINTIYQQKSSNNPHEAILISIPCLSFSEAQWRLVPDVTKCSELKGSSFSLQQSSWPSINNQRVYLKPVDAQHPEAFTLYQDYESSTQTFSKPLIVSAQEASASNGELRKNTRLPNLKGLFAASAGCFSEVETLHIELDCEAYKEQDWAKIPQATRCKELAQRPLILNTSSEKWSSINGVKVSLDHLGGSLFRAWRLTQDQTRIPLTPNADDLDLVGSTLRIGSLSIPQMRPGRLKPTLGLYGWLNRFLPILILLAVIVFVIMRLPKIDLGHKEAFKRRRVMNWLPMGLTYAFLYMGRYNLTVASGFLIAAEVIRVSDFGIIFAAGTVTYGLSFLINGPLTDRYGGKLAILVGSGGSAVCNLAMGLLISTANTDSLVRDFSLLYALNMYFQSFGAVAIVKVNAPWFHVNERGVFGAIFGILISLGVYFAFDWGALIVDNFSLPLVFFTPAVILSVLWFVDLLVVKNTPSEAGFEDFDTADASSGDDGPHLKAIEVFKMMLSNRVIITIACIEFCSGFLRQAIMQYYRIFSKAIGTVDSFVYENWGLLLCCAGIMGGVFAGVISDRIFNSRRGPVAGVLYGFMLIGSILMCFFLDSPALGGVVIFLSLSVIGVHGMLSGTASMDFGGKRNVGVAVGIIDGFVYLGTGFMALLYSFILPSVSCDRIAVENWIAWPIAMIPMALIGFILALKIWDAKPKAHASK